MGKQGEYKITYPGWLQISRKFWVEKDDNTLKYS